MRSTYAGAAVVLSDRLHSLIIAATESAVPLGWTSNPNPKVGEQFRVVGLDDIALDGEAALVALGLLDSAELAHRRGELPAILSNARTDISAAASQLTQRVASVPAVPHQR